MKKEKKKEDFSYCQETVMGGSALVKGGGVRIRLMAERTAKPGVLAHGVFFEGGDVLRCYRGRFRFTIDGGGGGQIL